jgi:hypothetical protein
MNARHNRSIQITRIAIVCALITLVTGLPLLAQPAEPPEQIFQKLGEHEQLLNPYCRPRLKALKQEIAEDKKRLRQSKTPQEEWTLIKRLYELHDDLKKVRAACKSKYFHYELDEAEE